MTTAPVNKIIDSSLVDGPGNRTSIFVQGCNYHCTYCHNPETISLCRHCGDCVDSCPVGALSMRDGQIVWDADIRVACDACIKTCPHLASPRVRWMTADEVAQRVARNAPFLKGITVSGGECTLYKDFLMELFSLVKPLGLSCLIDSNGSMDFREHPDLLALADGVMLDIKAVELDEYRAITGGDGSRILDIAVHLASLGKLTEVRTVCAPGLHSADTVEAVCRRIAPLQAHGDIHYRLIAYRPYGVREPYRSTILSPSSDEMEALYKLAKEHGMTHVTVV